MSHIGGFSVLTENNLTQRKGHDNIFSLFNMTKIDSYLQNQSWLLLFRMPTIGSYSENRILMPLYPIRRANAKSWQKTTLIPTAPDQRKHLLQSHASVYISFDKALSSVCVLNAAL